MKKFFAACFAVLLLCGATGCQNEATVSAPELLEPVGVKLDTAVVQRSDVYDASMVAGAVVPYVEEIQFTIDGKFGEFHVAVGDMVEKGQLLATLDTETTNTQIENLQAEINNTLKLAGFSDQIAQNNIAIAKEELAIMKESGASKETCTAKEIAIKQLETDLEQTKQLREMELNRKKASIQELKAVLPNMEVRAPFSGRVVYTRNLKEGNSLNAYTTVVCIADDTQLSISSEYISERIIESSDRIYAKIEGIDCDITYIPYELDEYISSVLSGQDMRTKFSINEPDPSLQGGQYAAIMIIDNFKENVLTVPVNALYEDLNHNYYVYKMDGEKRTRCEVKVGHISDIEAEIAEGLQEGDVVYVKE